MKVLQVHNFTRFRGGGDRVFELTVDGLRGASTVPGSASEIPGPASTVPGGASTVPGRTSSVEVHTFTRDSRELAKGIRGRVGAALNGLRPPREALQAFQETIETLKPDVVHVHELYPFITPWVLGTCTDHGIPVVMSCHEFRLTCPVGTHLRAGRPCRICLDTGSAWPCARFNCRERRSESLAFALRHRTARRRALFSKHVTCYLTASAYMQRHLEAAGFGPVHHLPFPIAPPEPDTALEPDTRFGEPAGPGEYAAYAGRFVPEKGIHTLLAAAHRTGIPVRLAGRVGSLPLDLPPKASCVGELHGAELAAFYQNARFLVVPSEWEEPYGLVAGEAQQFGRPVIATRVGGLQELVHHGETGLLVPPGDVKALAHAMTTLWSDPERSRAMGEAGRTWIESHASLPVYIKRLVQLYGDLA